MQTCPKLKKRNFQKNGNPIYLGAWSDDDTSEEYSVETANICFKAIGETSEVRVSNCKSCIDLQNYLDMVIDKIQKVIDEYNKLAKKQNRQILLDVSQVEI